MSNNAEYNPIVTPTSASNRGWRDYVEPAAPGTSRPARPVRPVRPVRGMIRVPVVAADPVPLRPFPPEYDTWDQIEQRNYERGRLRAAGWKLTGARRVPKREPADSVQRTNGLRLVPRRHDQPRRWRPTRRT